MEFSELKLKSMEELRRLLLEQQEKLFKLRFKVSEGQLKNVREVRYIKKDIARILTALSDERKK